MWRMYVIHLLGACVPQAAASLRCMWRKAAPCPAAACWPGCGVVVSVCLNAQGSASGVLRPLHCGRCMLGVCAVRVAGGPRIACRVAARCYHSPTCAVARGRRQPAQGTAPVCLLCVCLWGGGVLGTVVCVTLAASGAGVRRCFGCCFVALPRDTAERLCVLVGGRPVFFGATLPQVMMVCRDHSTCCCKWCRAGWVPACITAWRGRWRHRLACQGPLPTRIGGMPPCWGHSPHMFQHSQPLAHAVGTSLARAPHARSSHV
jgi:hypothetical protein